MKPSSFTDVIDGGFCRFIEGDTKKKSEKFCPKKSIENSSYCQEHTTLCHQKSTPIDIDKLIKFIDFKKTILDD